MFCRCVAFAFSENDAIVPNQHNAPPFHSIQIWIIQEAASSIIASIRQRKLLKPSSCLNWRCRSWQPILHRMDKPKLTLAPPPPPLSLDSPMSLKWRDGSELRVLPDGSILLIEPQAVYAVRGRSNTLSPVASPSGAK